MASLGSTPGLIIAAGVGAAASVALEPAFEVPKQDAWARLPNRILDIGTLARLVAQGGVVLGNPNGQTDGSAYGEARRRGYGPDKLDRLVWLELKAPDLALVLELWRRGKLGDVSDPTTIAKVEYALAKEQIEPTFWPGLKELFSERLDPALIATMVQRSILANAVRPGTQELLLPNQPSAKDSNVPKMPQVDLDTLLEAQAHGIDFDRLAAEARIVGLPASPDLAARMVFREIINRDAFNQAILEGNTRGEWAPFLFEGFREILTANQYAELELRGFLNPAQRLKNTDKHGMSKEDSDLLYNLLGRSIPVHQIITGEARGGTFDGPIDTIPKAILSSLQRGNLRPEFYNLAHANRYSYPSAFFFRLLISEGDLTPDEGEQAFLEIGWSPKWAKLIAQALAPKTAATAAKANPWLVKAQNQWWTAAHKDFVKYGVTRDVIEPIMEVLVPDLADRDGIFQWWTDERATNSGAPPPA